MATLSTSNVSIRAGNYTFTHVTYDAPSDVLYAAIDVPRPGTRHETPESDVLRFDQRGEFFGVILVNPRERLERDGTVRLTLPSGDLVRVQGIEAAIRVAT
jgi:uncharacterized protein YuzE